MLRSLTILSGVAAITFGWAMASEPVLADAAPDCTRAGLANSVFPDRIFLRSFSVVPPTGPGWCISGPDVFRSSISVGFVDAEMGQRVPPDHTYYVAAELTDVDGDVPTDLAGLEALARKWIDTGANEAMQLNGKVKLTLGPVKGGERFTLKHGNSAPDASVGLDCVAYDTSFEEHANPRFPGVLILNAKGLLCLLPNSPTELLQFVASERYPADRPPATLLLSSRATQAETFFKSVFLPMPTTAEEEAGTKAAAERGNPLAQFAMGLASHNRGDFAEARKWYEKAAEAGNVGAYDNLGVIYGAGLGVKKDHAQAAKWFALAADKGAAEAQFQLAMLYWMGDGVPADEARAVALMRKSAKQGMAISMVNMGDIYRDGNGGTPVDVVRADGWYIKGLERAQGEPELTAMAKDSQKKLEATMTKAQIAAARKWAAEWTPETD